jgi:hypothetical protein
MTHFFASDIGCYLCPGCTLRLAFDPAGKYSAFGQSSFVCFPAFTRPALGAECSRFRLAPHPEPSHPCRGMREPALGSGLFLLQQGAWCHMVYQFPASQARGHTNNPRFCGSWRFAIIRDYAIIFAIFAPIFRFMIS